jgi:hypothetical protein
MQWLDERNLLISELMFDICLLSSESLVTSDV